MIRWIRAFAALFILATPQQARAQTGENVLLVTNALSPGSQEIGDYYAGKRAVPNQNLLRLALPLTEEVSRAEYESKIERPIADWLSANSAQDRILYIVLTKDVPLRVAGTTGPNGTVASVDSELTLLYRKLYTPLGSPAGSLKNPFFTEGVPTPATVRFTHKTHDIYLVARLDGFTVADVKALIDRAQAPSRDGVVVLDGKVEVTQSVGGRWLNSAATALKSMPGFEDRVVVDSGLKIVTDQSRVGGFYTWGSNALGASERHYRLQFLPGAVAAEYVSTDARTFKEPPADWMINDTASPFGGSHQSLIGDLIRDGVTGVAGHVAEPFLNATIRPDILFPAYLSGFNLVESFYMAMPALSWQTVVVGDPLCAPYGPRVIAAAEISPETDANTEMPAFFSARRMQVVTGTGSTPEMAQRLLKAEARRAKKDTAGERQALEEATMIDPDFAAANLALGMMYEANKEWDLAIDRYRRTIAKSPNMVVALNNLAWVLATAKNNPQEAFQFATKAYVISVQSAEVGDTLAWVYHLMGNDRAAEPIALSAARLLPNRAEAQLHTATILAGVNRLAPAREFLDTALRLDPSLAASDAVIALQQRLAANKP